jgi:hypothetical protein
MLKTSQSPTMADMIYPIIPSAENPNRWSLTPVVMIMEDPIISAVIIIPKVRRLEISYFLFSKPIAIQGIPGTGGSIRVENANSVILIYADNFISLVNEVAIALHKQKSTRVSAEIIVEHVKSRWA